jgi:hypothetical protein
MTPKSTSNQDRVYVFRKLSLYVSLLQQAAVDVTLLLCAKEFHRKKEVLIYYGSVCRICTKRNCDVSQMRGPAGLLWPVANFSAVQVTDVSQMRGPAGLLRPVANFSAVQVTDPITSQNLLTDNFEEYLLLGCGAVGFR